MNFFFNIVVRVPVLSISFCPGQHHQFSGNPKDNNVQHEWTGLEGISINQNLNANYCRKIKSLENLNPSGVIFRTWIWNLVVFFFFGLVRIMTCQYCQLAHNGDSIISYFYFKIWNNLKWVNQKKFSNIFILLGILRL